MSTQTMTQVIAEYFKTQPVLKAWLFGSFARGEQTEDSDIDVLVDMPATLRAVGGANDYLEQITGRHVDMIRRHRNLTPFFLKQVEKDGVRIF